MRSGLWAIRDGTKVYVGSGSPEDVAEFRDQWEAAGWSTRAKTNVTARRKLRGPYEPLTCAYCEWAGLNLGVHHARSHEDKPAPSPPLVAPVIAAQARTARATQDRNRRPRAGLLVVDEVTHGEVNVYRVQRVSGGKVTLKMLGRTAEGLDRIPFTLTTSEVLSRFSPVGRWVGMRPSPVPDVAHEPS